MKIDGIDGDVRAKGYEKWIEIDSFSWGLNNIIGGGSPGAAVGKVHFSDITIMKKAEKGSPFLMLDCAKGQLLPAVQFVLTRVLRDTQQKYYKIELENVLISSFMDSGDNGGDIPTETISLNFSKIHYTIYLEDADRSVKPQTVGWDVKAGHQI